MDKAIVIKRGSGAIKVEATVFKNKPYIDVRNYYAGADGELKPTPKGIMVPVENAEEVAKAILKQLSVPGLKSDSAEKPSKFYTVVPPNRVAHLSEHDKNKSLSVPDTQIFEDLATAKASKKFVGSGLFSITGTFTLKDDKYVFAKGVKCKLIAIREKGVWVREQ